MYMRGWRRCCRFPEGRGGPEGPWEGTQSQNQTLSQKAVSLHKKITF